MAKQSIVSIATTPDDLCNWEFVNHFDFEIKGDDDDGSIYEVESVDLVESVNSLSSSSDEEENDHDDQNVEEREGPTNVVDVHDDHGDGDGDAVECSRVSDLGQNHVCDDDVSNFFDSQHNLGGFLEYNNGSILLSSGHEHQHDDDDVDDDDDDGYDMDDELVPWEVKDRLVRQRIRKSGKISIGRAAKSKKSALVFTRPGCVRGKHGLGLKVY